MPIDMAHIGLLKKKDRMAFGKKNRVDAFQNRNGRKKTNNKKKRLSVPKEFSRSSHEDFIGSQLKAHRGGWR